MDDYQELKRMLNGVLIRAKTIIAAIDFDDDSLILDRHVENCDRLCGVLDIYDEMDGNNDPETREILTDFFLEYESVYMILDRFYINDQKIRQHG